VPTILAQSEIISSALRAPNGVDELSLRTSRLSTSNSDVQVRHITSESYIGEIETRCIPSSVWISQRNYESGFAGELFVIYIFALN
jgi:hypothetical protein